MGRRENFQKRKRNEWNETKQKKRNETNDGWRHLRGGASRPSRRFPRSFVSFRFFCFVSFHSFRFRFWKFSLHMARPNLSRFYIRFNFLQPYEAVWINKISLWEWKCFHEHLVRFVSSVFMIVLFYIYVHSNCLPQKSSHDFLAPVWVDTAV